MDLFSEGMIGAIIGAAGSGVAVWFTLRAAGKDAREQAALEAAADLITFLAEELISQLKDSPGPLQPTLTGKTSLVAALMERAKHAEMAQLLREIAREFTARIDEFNQAGPSPDTNRQVANSSGLMLEVLTIWMTAPDDFRVGLGQARIRVDAVRHAIETRPRLAPRPSTDTPQSGES
jgi:hypothetical protein